MSSKVCQSGSTEAIERPMEVGFQIQRCLARTTQAHSRTSGTQSPRTEIGHGTGSSSVMAGSQARSKKHPYDSVDDALKSQEFRCGHCGALVMVLRLQLAARAGRAGKAQRLRSAGSGDGKWWGVSKVVHPHPWLAHGRTRASHSRRPVSATEISIRSRKSGRDPLPMVPDPRHRRA